MRISRYLSRVHTRIPIETYSIYDFPKGERRVHPLWIHALYWNKVRLLMAYSESHLLNTHVNLLSEVRGMMVFSDAHADKQQML